MKVRSHFSPFPHFFPSALSATMLACLTACGGGGSSGLPDGSSANTSNSSSSTGTSTASSEDQMKARLAFVAEASMKDDPVTIAQAATLSQLVDSGANFDASVVKAKFDLVRSEFQAWSATARASALDAQMQVFRITAKQLDGAIANSQKFVTQAMYRTVDVSGQTTVFTPGPVPSNAVWNKLASQNYQSVLDGLYTSCQSSTIVKKACDDAFSVKVSLQFTDRCATSTEGWCTALKNNSLKTDQANLLRDQMQQAMTQLQGLAYACSQGKTECAAQDPDLKTAKKGVALIGTASKGLKWVGAIDERQMKQFQSVAEGLGAVAVNSAKIYRILGTVDPIGIWDKATTVKNWTALIFGDAKKSGGLNLAINDIESLLNAFSSIEGAIHGIVEVFGGTSVSSTDAQLLEGIKQIQDMIRALQANMTARFDSVDYQLATISVNMADSLQTVNRNVLDLSAKAEAAQRAMSMLANGLNRLDTSLSAAISALAEQNLVGLQSIERDAGQNQAEDDLVTAFNWTMSASIDATSTSNSGSSDFLDDLYGQLSTRGISFNLGYLSRMSMVYTGTPITTVLVANPDTIVFGGRRYLDILRLRPAYAKAAAPMVYRQLQQLLNDRILPAQAFVGAVQNSNLINALQASYADRAAELKAAIEAAAPAFLRAKSPVGYDYSLLPLWGADDQATQYVPRFFRLGKLLPCDGTFGPVLSVPTNWGALVDDVSSNAELLGLTYIDACYALPSSNNGWGQMWLEKIKVDRYWAWGGLDITINTSVGGKTVKSRTLAVPDAAGRGYLNSRREGICFFFTKDDIRIAAQAVPAANVVAAAWQDGTKFSGNDWCNDVGVKPSNLSSAFSTSSTLTFQWPAEAGRNEALQRIKNARQSLRQDFNAYVALAIRAKTGDVGAAALRLDGARLALSVALQAGYPQAMIDNLGFRAAFNGKEALPDSLAVADMLAASDASNTTSVDFVTLASTRSIGLAQLVEAERQRVKAGQAKYVNPILENLRIEMELQLAVARAALSK